MYAAFAFSTARQPPLALGEVTSLLSEHALNLTEQHFNMLFGRKDYYEELMQGSLGCK